MECTLDEVRSGHIYDSATASVCATRPESATNCARDFFRIEGVIETFLRYLLSTYKVIKRRFYTLTETTNTARRSAVELGDDWL